ncbi:hypothetical protein [Mycoplasmopsis felifaucium]|uniref:hypothetical protein n=1 Tax=Mycoplasmopsis felifaucium TaxID=35768 RepID=UPI001F286223|nr:hypothetical protein [Mycoplasmopsis felifaucium]
MFSEEKLKEILHYTDNENNPAYDAYKSNAFFRIYSGAKGVSKSFGRMVETIYRIVNEKNFCSVWCRNQYNHIKTTLRPMVEKVLNFLAEEHNLDFREYFYITNEACYWNYDDGGKGRAIYFQNWEKIQAFQGLTLQNPLFRFGELVIDEPLEDTADTNKLPHELIELYEKQHEKLPLLIQNTVLRENAPEGFQVNVSFLYNIFTFDHFLITDYHNKVIPILKEDGNTNDNILNELITQTYLQNYDPDFQNGLGLVVTMFSKYFVPSEQLGTIQKKNLELLKEQNYRLWVITVAGFGQIYNNKNHNYFLKSVLFDESGELKKGVIQNINIAKFKTLLKNGEVIGVYAGFDVGIHDNASLVLTALLGNGKIIILKTFEDIKELFKTKKNINLEMCKAVIKEIKKINSLIEEFTPYNYVNENFLYGKTSLIFCDSNAIIEQINLLIEENGLNSTALTAVRKPSQRFGIIDRQFWEKWIFENKLIYFMPGTHSLIKNLAKQVIPAGEEKRDEEINHEIYDLINAFEMSNSIAFKYQYKLLSEEVNNGNN